MTRRVDASRVLTVVGESPRGMRRRAAHSSASVWISSARRGSRGTCLGDLHSPTPRASCTVVRQPRRHSSSSPQRRISPSARGRRARGRVARARVAARSALANTRGAAKPCRRRCHVRRRIPRPSRNVGMGMAVCEGRRCGRKSRNGQDSLRVQNPDWPKCQSDRGVKPSDRRDCRNRSVS